MSSKLIWLWIIIILIILGLFYFYYQQEKKKSEEISISQSEEESLLEQPTKEEQPAEEKQSEEEPLEETDKTADWKTYTSDKYNYSFKYPADFNYGPCTTKPCSKFVYDKISGNPEKDYVLLQGDISEKGWPNISVVHYDTEFYNPPSGTDLVEWLKEKSPFSEYVPDELNFEIDDISAVKIHVPASPQAYSSDGVYFIKDGNLFEISMTDVETEEAQDFYNLFLSTFKFAE